MFRQMGINRDHKENEQRYKEWLSQKIITKEVYKELTQLNDSLKFYRECDNNDD